MAEYLNNRESVHLCWEFPPHITGGLGVACSSITKALAQHASVRVLHPSLVPGAMPSAGYSSYYVPVQLEAGDFDRSLQHLIAGESCRSLPRELQGYTTWVLSQKFAERFVVHGHDWHSIFAGLALKKLYGHPFVLHLHSTQLERIGHHAHDFLYHLEKWGIAHADAVLTVSEQSAQLLVSEYGVARECVHVVCNTSFAVAEIPRREPGNSCTLLFVGRLCSQKSPELLLEVFRRLVRKYPLLQLLMVGEGEMLESLRSVVEFCGLRERVLFLGKLEHAKMAKIYQRSDILCVPSIDEPFGLVALEAAQHGVSVVLSDRCGAREILKSAPVVSGRNVGAWVRELSVLIDCEQSRNNLAIALKKEAASRTWQDAACEILAIYEGLMPCDRNQ